MLNLFLFLFFDSFILILDFKNFTNSIIILIILISYFHILDFHFIIRFLEI